MSQKSSIVFALTALIFISQTFPFLSRGFLSFTGILPNISQKILCSVTNRLSQKTYQLTRGSDFCYYES